MLVLTCFFTHGYSVVSRNSKNESLRTCKNSISKYSINIKNKPTLCWILAFIDKIQNVWDKTFKQNYLYLNIIHQKFEYHLETFFKLTLATEVAVTKLMLSLNSQNSPLIFPINLASVLKTKFSRWKMSVLLSQDFYYFIDSWKVFLSHFINITKCRP